MCLQFTLQCVLKGNKPDFHCAMTADESRALYGSLLENMKKTYEPDKIKGKGIYILSLGLFDVSFVADGVFGAYMQVHIQNDGPVTIPLESSPSQPSKVSYGVAII